MKILAANCFSYSKGKNACGKEKSVILRKIEIMSLSVLLDKKISTVLTKLTSRQKQALLTVAETFVEEQTESYNTGLLKEIDKRFAEYESGKVKSISLDTLEARARKSYQSKKAKAK